MTDLNTASAALVERLLTKRQVRVRRRWAIIQLNIWLQHGWVTAQGEGVYQLTKTGEQTFRQQLMAHSLPSLELILQQLDIQLPEHCNSRIMSCLLNQERVISEEQIHEHDIKLQRDSYLLLRSDLPCSIFMRSGELLDISALLRAWGEVAIPERVIPDIKKILWKDGQPHHIITVDNRDTFVSLSLPPNSLLIHAPIKATYLAEQFMLALMHDMPWSHLGDLSPDGILQAAEFAARLQRPLSLYLPANWPDYLRLLGHPLMTEEKWPLAVLSRKQQISLQFLIENQQKLPQQVMVYAKNWLHVA
ncbi:hypothetical protein [Tolumonas lignilytica]|uniref:hypothetical protein n=1 Tax=Tolumonas lignilytica TaxID=1283284 RepID=UPI0004660167|nr:hypothetical protein [Tolumonas lignilytica]